MSEKIKNKNVIETVRALRVLDGTENERFRFSGVVLYSMSKNLRRLAEVTEDIEKARLGLVKKHELGNKTNEAGVRLPDDPKALHAFQEEYTLLMEVETEVVVTKFKLADLKLDENNIPVSALAGLVWLIND